MKKLLLVFLIVFSIGTSAFCFSGSANLCNSGAENLSTEENAKGLYARITLKLYSGDGKVFAEANNVFTLFPSIVPVYVELYYSYNYELDYHNMILASQDYIYDLDQGHSIVTSASTEGELRYWQARVQYKVDSGAWQEGMTNTVLIDGNGNTTSFHRSARI